MTQDNLIEGEEKTVLLTEKELNRMIQVARSIEREEIALMLSKDAKDKNSTTRATIARLVDLVRSRSNDDTRTIS
jgi:hypothetical protein